MDAPDRSGFLFFAAFAWGMGFVAFLARGYFVEVRVKGWMHIQESKRWSKLLFTRSSWSEAQWRRATTRELYLSVAVFMFMGLFGLLVGLGLDRLAIWAFWVMFVAIVLGFIGFSLRDRGDAQGRLDD